MEEEGSGWVGEWVGGGGGGVRKPVIRCYMLCAHHL